MDREDEKRTMAIVTQQTPYTREQRRLLILRWLMGLNALAGFLLLSIDYGVDVARVFGGNGIRHGFVMIGFIFIVGYALQLVIRHDRWDYLRHNLLKYTVTGIVAIEFFIVYVLRIDVVRHTLLTKEFDLLTNMTTHTLLFKAFLLIHILRWVVKGSQFLAQFNTSPPKFMLVSFGGVILSGALLLLMPRCHVAELSFLDALFTSTSAVCVTGLIVVDTATKYTTHGQLVILGLIQIGGLGLMTMTAFFSLFVGQKMSGREQVLLQDMLATDRLAKLVSVLKSVFLTTILFEVCGAVSLYFAWRGVFSHYPVKTVIYYSIFHSISAFCNAGFATFTPNLLEYVAHPQISLTVCLLIIFGGLGFGVLHNLGAHANARLQRKSSHIERVSVHSKLVLLMTAVLIVGGMALFLIVEWQRPLFRPLSTPLRLMAGFFQSVTCRTAGFNTIDIGGLSAPALLICIGLMFVGAGPGSTGGGMKVTTFAMLIATVVAFARGRTRVELFRRTIPTIVFYQTIVVTTMYLAVAVVVCFALTMTEADLLREAQIAPVDPAQPSRPLAPIDLLFETVSALGTVGLSTGVTPKLSDMGKSLILLTMFVGRVGPFTLALAIGQRQRVERYRYPEERVLIG